MGLFDWFKPKSERIDESISAFKNIEKVSDKELSRRYGEGIEEFSILPNSFSNTSASLNMFNRQISSRVYASEQLKIKEYRDIASMPEVAEVLEDASNESTQQNDEGDVITLEITDKRLSENENSAKNIKKAFKELFHNRININTVIDDLFHSYYIDGRLFLENIIDTADKKGGILRIKKLPADTLDFDYNPRTGTINWFVQYIGANAVLPASLEEAEKEKDKYITFYTDQITFIDSGKYGINRKDIIGYLDKVKAPYNQLKLLETSVIIYRIIRAPERLVFKIDVGNMPIEKANKYVEKVKNSMQKKVSFDPKTGQTGGEPEIVSMLENYFLPTSPTGRGSTIEAVGGSSIGFKEMDDIFYFQKKLYRALKYPLSRVASITDGTNAPAVVFSGISGGDITQDEIKWARFLKKNQDRFTEALLELFLIHLRFIGLSEQYGLDRTKLQIKMTPPNNFVDSMWQKERQAKMDNFDKYAQYVESGYFSKYYILKNILKMSDDEIKENIDGFVKDIELGLTKVDSADEIPEGIQQRAGGTFGDIGDEPSNINPEPTDTPPGGESDINPQNPIQEPTPEEPVK